MAKETCTRRYIWERTKKLWPHLSVSYVLVYAYSYRDSIDEIFKQLLIHINEGFPFSYFFFDLDYAGKYPLNFPVWYVTCLWICSIIIHYLYNNHKKCFVSAIAPVMIILIYGHIYRMFPSLNIGGDVGIFLNEYFLRAFAGMSTGVICFCVSDDIKDFKFSKLFWILIRTIEITTMTAFSWLALKYGERKTDMLLLLVLFIGTFCSFIHPENDNVLSVRISNVIKKASTYTYAIYLNHILVGMIIKATSIHLPDLNNLFCYYVCLILFSAATQNILWILGRQWAKLKRVFIVN